MTIASLQTISYFFKTKNTSSSVTTIEKRYERKEKQFSPAGNRTPVSRVTGGDTHHYTTEDCSDDVVVSGTETKHCFFGTLVFTLGVENNSILIFCVFGFVRLAIGVKQELASLLCYPIRNKFKTNRAWLTHVFPRFLSASCIYFEF